MKKISKVLYYHLRVSDNEVFYIGIGNKERAYGFNKSQRSKDWFDYVCRHGKPKVLIVKDNLTLNEAASLEVSHIKLIGRKDLGKGTLLNLSNGGEIHNVLGVKNGVVLLCLNSGKLYNSISSYCKEVKVPHSSISYFLRTGRSTIDHKVRLVVDNNVMWNTVFDKKESENLLNISDIDLIENNDHIDVKKLFKNIDKKYIMAIIVKNIHNKTFKEIQLDFGFDIATIYYKGLNKINKKSIRKGSYNCKGFEIEKIYNEFKLIKEYSSLLNHLIS
jgi:predicted regulator of amino acid metabolism with ACT domain